MEISNMLLEPQVRKLEQNYRMLKAKLQESSPEDNQTSLKHVDASLRQIEKMREALKSVINSSDMTLQVIYLNFRELKLKFRIELRKYQRFHIMHKRTLKTAKARHDKFEAVFAA